MRTDQYNGHDYFNMDDLLSEEHKLVRDSARAWIKKEVSPIIEDAFEKGKFPRHLIKGLGEIGGFGPYIISPAYCYVAEVSVRSTGVSGILA